MWSCDYADLFFNKGNTVNLIIGFIITLRRVYLQADSNKHIPALIELNV